MSVLWGLDPFLLMGTLFTRRFPGHEIYIHAVPDMGNGDSGAQTTRIVDLEEGRIIEIYLDTGETFNDMFDQYVAELALVAADFNGLCPDLDEEEFEDLAEDEERFILHLPKMIGSDKQQAIYRTLCRDWVRALREHRPELITDDIGVESMLEDDKEDWDAMSPKERRSLLRVMDGGKQEAGENG